MSHIVNVRALQLFHFVAKYGGVSRAARMIPYGISQPALSEQMLQLEAEMQVVLFCRRPFKLTPEGEEMYEFGKPYFDNVDAKAVALRHDAPDLIRVASSPILLQVYLPTILQTLQRTFPKLSFTLRHGLQPQIEKLLIDQEVDLAVTVREGKPPPNCVSESLIHLPLVLLVPTSSPLRSAAQLWRQDPIVAKLIAPSEDDVVMRFFRRGLAKRRTEWRVTHDLNSVDTIETFTSKGFGVGLSARIPGRPRPQELRELSLDGFPELDIAMFWRAKPSRVTLALIAELRKAAKALSKLL
jgi:DNA-binding transcriptional LysR family regulator